MNNIDMASFFLGSFVSLPFILWSVVAQINLNQTSEENSLLRLVVKEKEDELVKQQFKFSSECATMIYSKEETERKFQELLDTIEAKDKEIESLKKKKKRKQKQTDVSTQDSAVVTTNTESNEG